MAVSYVPGGAERERREHTLVRMLKSEEEDALGYAQTEVTEQQIEALKRYFGETYGDEEDGRSQVCTREVFEAIEWQRPDYARVVAPGGNILHIQETSPQDSEYAEDVKSYLEWIMWSDNPGFKLIDDFVFDGLLHRRGYLAIYWRDSEYRAPQTLTGLNIMQVQQLIADPSVEIVGQDFDEESEAGGIKLVVRRVKSPARAEIVSIAPEDMRVNGRFTEIDRGRYIGRVHRIMRGEAMRMWPDKAQDLKDYSGKGTGHGQGRRGDDVRAQRFNDNDQDFAADGNDAAIELEILEEYLRVDLDEDDYPELIRSYRCGDLILDFEEVEENPFASWTPIRIPHRWLGLSVHDIVSDLQRQSTVITRAGLDALYQSVVNREAYDKNKVALDTLLATYSGSKVEVDGSPHDAIMPLTGGLDTATNAWQALELLARRIEDRTGSTRQTRGIDSDAISKEHSGKALERLQLNADARKELTARNLADGLSDLFSKLYRLVCRNQNQARQAKIGGEWCQFDPRTWNSELRVTVHIASTNREQQLLGLTMIGQEQEKVIEILGVTNPNVTPLHRYRYQEDLCRLAGYKDASPYFAQIPEGWEPPPPADPEAQKIQAEMAMQEKKMQMEAAQTQLQYQKDMELAAQQQTDERERNQVTAIKDERDAALAAQKLELDAERLAFEREKAAAEMELKARELQLKGAEIEFKARESEASKEHEIKKMDRDYRHKKKLTMASEGKDTDELDAEDAGKPSAADAMMELVKELKRPRKIKRGKDGKAIELH